MNGEPREPLAIIVAMTDPATGDFEAKLARFAEEAGPLGEVFVYDSSGGLNLEWLAKDYPNVRVIYRPDGQLAPQLWRDGLIKSQAPLVAFTTSHMMLSSGWRIALIDRLVDQNASGVGGPIQPALKLSRIDRAVALLRYSRYFPPRDGRKSIEPPGDNALYRRDRLQVVQPSWADGFWEVEVHKALLAQGDSLTMADSATVTFDGGSRWRSILSQRIQHAKRYGASRSQSLNGFVRLMKIVASPLVPPLLTFRSYWNLWVSRRSLLPWFTAGPGLMILASAWAFGEAIGTWQGPNVPPVKSRRVRSSKKR